MAAPSDDRNGVVVNRARSRRGTSDKLNNRHSELSGRGEVQQIASSEIRAKSEGVLYSASILLASTPKIQISTKLYSEYWSSNFYWYALTRVSLSNESDGS